MCLMTAIDRFRNSDKTNALPMLLSAGGTWININEARIRIIYNL